MGEMGLSGRGWFRAGLMPAGVRQERLNPSKALPPVSGLGGHAPFPGGLWAGRGTEIILPVRKGLWGALAWVMAPGLIYL